MTWLNFAFSTPVDVFDARRIENTLIGIRSRVYTNEMKSRKLDVDQVIYTHNLLAEPEADVARLRSELDSALRRLGDVQLVHRIAVLQLMNVEDEWNKKSKEKNNAS